jgi:16S rRNA processing protein RimM
LKYSSLDDLVAVATVGKPFGLKGMCALFPIGETLVNSLLPISLWVGNDTGIEKITLLEIAGEYNNYRCVFEGCCDRDDANKYKNLFLYMERERLPKLDEGEFYFRDLVGLSVESESGEKLGVISDVFNYPTTDAIDVRMINGKVITIPFRKEIVKSVSLEKSKMLVDRVAIDELMF